MTEEELKRKIKNLKNSYINVNNINNEISNLKNCISYIENNNEGNLIDTLIEVLNNQVSNLQSVRDELVGANSKISKKISALENELRKISIKNVDL